jgi:hypothetical protein
MAGQRIEPPDLIDPFAQYAHTAHVAPSSQGSAIAPRPVRESEFLRDPFASTVAG